MEPETEIETEAEPDVVQRSIRMAPEHLLDYLGLERRPQQVAALASGRTFHLEGPLGSGMSTLACLLALQEALAGPGRKVVLVAPVWARVEALLERLAAYARAFSKSRIRRIPGSLPKVELCNGSRIYFSLPREAAILNIRPSLVVADQASLVDPSFPAAAGAATRTVTLSTSEA